MLSSFINDWSPLAIGTKAIWLVQLGLIVHVLKTGRPYWWFWILFSAPVIGGIAYTLIELAPDLRSSGAGASLNWKPRRWRIRDLRAELEETDTVKLRLTLASELLAAQDLSEAREQAEQCLTGVWRDDPHTLAAVARYRLEAGDAKAALEALEKIRIEADRMLATQVAVLRGRAWVVAGRDEEGQAVLRSALDRHIGEEPRYFLAVSLAKTGSVAEAREFWTDIRKRYRRANRGWRRSENRWFKLAGERLKETKV
jgi:hypothetical protein